MRKNIVTVIIMSILANSCAAPEKAALPSEVRDAFTRAQMPLFDKQYSAKDWTLDTLDEKSITLSALKGKFVFVNFWATWCPPCRAEMASMENFYRRFKDEALEFVAIDIMEAKADVGGFIRNQGYTFPVAIDTDGRASRAYGVQAVPATFIVDKAGSVILTVIGSRQWDTPEVYAAFETLFRHGQ